MNTEIEIWKDIPGYEGYYQASNLGRIKSVERIALIRKKHFGTFKEKILKGRPDGDGYDKVALYKNTARRDYRIHKLIAITFLGHVPDMMKMVVDHIDEDTKNNNVNNLQLTTNRHNCSKGWKNTTSKYTGVHYSKKNGKWVTQITINYKVINIGTFNDEYSAHEAYQAKLKEIDNETYQKALTSPYK